MGAFTSRQNAGVEEVDISVNHAYRYPPKHGNYFSNHFIMGGERFDTALPEMYLFGENMDLNFLGSRPAPFPYPAPSASEPSKTLKALINIRKESLRFVKVHEETPSLKDSEPVVEENTEAAPPATDAGAGTGAEETAEPAPTPVTEPPTFNIEFTFDCDVRCSITVMYFCTEESTSQGLVYVPRDASMNSETYHYKRGANQQFSQSSHVFSPSIHAESDLSYCFDRNLFPVVVQCKAEEGDDPRQSQATIGIIEKHSDGFVLKALKQKLFVHGLCYLLQEIYGIENKNSDVLKSGDDEGEDNGAECVICMCDLRDTLILPCRHLCLCNCCADSLRYQANNCPICRAPFRALLQIKALQKISPGSAHGALPANDSGGDIPAGYEAVSLIEALNGPSVAPPVQPSAPANNDLYMRLPQNPVNNMYNRDGAGFGNLEDSTTQTDNTNSSSIDGIQMRMSVLLAAENTDDNLATDATQTRAADDTESMGCTRKNGGSRRHRDKANKDTVKVVNELKQDDPLASPDAVITLDNCSAPTDKARSPVRSAVSDDKVRSPGTGNTDAPIHSSAGSLQEKPPSPSRVPRSEGGSEDECLCDDDAPKRKRLETPLFSAGEEEVDDYESDMPSSMPALTHPLQATAGSDDALSVRSEPYLDPGVTNSLHVTNIASCTDTDMFHSAVDTSHQTDGRLDKCQGKPRQGQSCETVLTAPVPVVSYSNNSSGAGDQGTCRPDSIVPCSPPADTLSGPAETPSMPGTPLSNTSDASTSSANSSNALLQHTDQTRPSVV